MARRSGWPILPLISLFAVAPARNLLGQCSPQSLTVTSARTTTDTVAAGSTENTLEFTVKNTSSGGVCGEWDTLLVTGTGVFASGTAAPDRIYLDAPDSQMMTVTFSVTDVVSGTGTVHLEALGTSYHDSASASVNLYTQHAGPETDLVHAYLGTNRDVTKCVVSCFDAVTTYSTMRYTGHDQPQSLQLVYRSAVAYPRGLVSVFAYDTNSAGTPIRMSLQLKELNGTNVPFLSGANEVFFSCDTAGGHAGCNSGSQAWLAAQVDESGDTTGVYPRTLAVRSYFVSGSDTSYTETDQPIHVLVENESTSPFGAGWMIAGLQRLYVVGSGIGADSVAITDGNGSMAFFAFADSVDCETNETVCNFTSPPGDFSVVTWHSEDGRGATYSRRYPNGTTIGFNNLGQMLYELTASGVLTKYHYNSTTFQLDSINDSLTTSSVGETYLGYNGSSELAWVKDSGRVDSITVDGSGDLTQIKDAVGGVPLQATYDSNHRMIHRVDRRSGNWGLTYDFASKLATDTEPEINTNNGNNQRPVLRYRSLNADILDSADTGSWNNPFTTVTGEVAEATVANPRGFPTTYSLDRFGQAAETIQPLGRKSSTTFDSLGHRVKDVLPPGHYVRYTWNGPDLTQKKDSMLGKAAGPTVSYAYDSRFDLDTLVTGDVDSVRNILSSDGSTIDTTHFGSQTVPTFYTYTSYGVRVCTVVGDSMEYRATCNFPNSSGFLNTDSARTEAYPNTPPAASFTYYQYDGYGRRTRAINPVGDTTWTNYDLLGRVTSVIGPQRDTTKYTYDSLYLIQVEDARHKVYKVSPNALGWPDSTTDPAGLVTQFTYDSNGNIASEVNRRGQTITFTYDSLDQLRKRIAGNDTTTYFTDPLGAYMATSLHGNTDTVKVDSLGRESVEISCRDIGCFVDSSFYNDTFPVRTRLSVTALSGGLNWSSSSLAATYSYGPNVVLDSVTNFLGETETFGYAADLRDSTRTFRALNNLTETFGHPPWIQAPSSLSFSDTTLTREIGLSYSYDTLSRVTQYYHGIPTTPDTVRTVVDTAGRLVAYADTDHTSWSGSCSLATLGETCGSATSTKTQVGVPTTWVYDAVGNLKDSATATDTVADGNRLKQWSQFRMFYDADGNLTVKETLNSSQQDSITDSLWWNPLGQVDSVHVDNSSGDLTERVTYDYDGWGRRLRSTYGTTSLSPQRYLWDGNDLIVRMDTLGNNTGWYTYYPGSREMATFGNYHSASADTTYYLVTNALHNPVATIKNLGGGSYGIINQMRYTPLGVRMLTGPGSGVTTVAGFKGAFSDAEDGMWMMGGRKYDPTVGRFISEDPAGLSGGINLYTFGGDDPVNGYDPEGRFNVNGFDLYVEHLLLLGGFMAFGAPYIFEDFTLFLEAHGAASVGLVADLAGFTQSLESPIEEALLVGAIHEGLIDHDLDGDDGAPENGLLDIAGFLAFPLGHEVAVAAGTLDAAGVVGGSYVAWRDNHPVQPRYALGTLDQRCVPQVSVGTGLSAFPTTAAAQSLSGRFWDPKRPGVIQGQSPSRAANGQCATP